MLLRLSKRKKLNRYDKFKYSFYTKVQNGFIKIQKKTPKKYMKINSNIETYTNKKLIINKIDKLI
jgi:dTMP kinase